MPVQAPRRVRLALLGLTFAALVTAPHPILSQTAAPKAIKGATVEGITEYALPNGMKVLLVPDPSRPTVTVNLTILSGSKHEGLGETGMAHLIEHMFFKGSPRHPNVPKELNDHGAGWNGTTWYDRTNYFETVKATDENLDWALDLEADLLVNASMRKADLQSEFTVVRNEFEAGENSPFRVLLERVMSAQFLWHNYGKSTIGNRADIEGVPIERLSLFYRKNYQPDNAMLVVAGKFDLAKALHAIEQKFGTIPKPARSLEKGNLLFASYSTEPAQDGERATVLRRAGDVQLLMAGYHVPAGTHPDFAAVDVMATILGEEVTGRLYKALVETKLVSTVGAFSFQLHDPGVLIANAQLRQEMDFEKARAAFVRVLDDFSAAPPSSVDVDQARTKLLKEIDLSLNNSEQVGIGLSEWASMGDWRFQFIHRDRIKAVTAADVQRVAKAYLLPSNRTIGEFHPAPTLVRAEIAPTPSFSRLVDEYKGTETRVAGEAFDAAPAAIDARVTTRLLPNGMKLQLLARKTRGGMVNAEIQLRYGTEQSLTDRAAIASAAAQMLERGTATKSREQVKETFDRLKARVSFGSDPSGASVDIETVRDNLVPTLHLVGELFRNPSFPATEFEKLRQELLARLEQKKSQPDALGLTAARRAVAPYPKGHPLYVPTIDEDIANTKAMQLADVSAFWKRFYGASHATAVVAGDFDAAAVGKELTDAFGDWSSGEPYARVTRRAAKVDSAYTKIETPDKQMAVFVSVRPVALTSTDPEWVALRVANYIFGESPLSDRIGTRLRQKEGLSYGSGSALDTDMQNPAGSHMAFAIYAPQNAERLVTAYREELDRALKDGFTEEEVAKAKHTFIEQRFQQRSDNSNLPGMALLRTENGLTFATWDGVIEERVQKLTVAEVNAAFRKYVGGKNAVWVVAGDFEGAKKKQAAPIP